MREDKELVDQLHRCFVSAVTLAKELEALEILKSDDSEDPNPLSIQASSIEDEVRGRLIDALKAIKPGVKQ